MWRWLFGGVLSLVYLVPEWGELVTTSNLVRDLIAVLSVGLSALLMVLTDTEHPPAAGTALGLVVVGWAPSSIVFVLVGALTLSIIHLLLRPHLRDLL